MKSLVAGFMFMIALPFVSFTSYAEEPENAPEIVDINSANIQEDIPEENKDLAPSDMITDEEGVPYE